MMMMTKVGPAQAGASNAGTAESSTHARDEQHVSSSTSLTVEEQRCVRRLASNVAEAQQPQPAHHASQYDGK